MFINEPNYLLSIIKMIVLAQGGPKVLVTESRIHSLIPKTQIQTANEQIKLLLNKQVYVGISKYSDSFMIVINQTGTMGSLYKGKYAGEVLPQIWQQDFDSIEQKTGQNLTAQKIYDIKCLFGSTEIQFYELLIRKLLQILFEENKTDSTISLLVNVSLPVKWKSWDDYEHKYYQAIINQVSQSFKELS